MSHRAIGAAIRSTGGSISNAALGELVNAERKASAHGLRLRYANLNARIATEKLPFAQVDIRSRYSYSVRIRGTDVHGNYLERHVTVQTNNSNRTRAEIEASALDAVSEEGQSDTMTDSEAMLVDGRQRQPRSI